MAATVIEKDLIIQAFELLKIEAQGKDSRAKERFCQFSTFYRDYVSPNLPVVIKNGCTDFTAMDMWSRTYLRNVLGDKEISIAVTPDGYADAVKSIRQEDGTIIEYFVVPEERCMKFSSFLDVLDKPEEHHGVFYLQSQSDNLNQCFPELLIDVGDEIPWASEAFNKEPDAVNFWMGDGRAVSSLHKDPYENIYCVISGYKDFILLPPTDRPWIPYKTYPSAVHHQNPDGTFDIKPLEEDACSKVPWICIDPLKPDLDAYPLYKNANPIHVRVGAGDVLYIPSLWFHHVRQSHGCVAVNYWYDMQFDIKYAYYELLEKLATSL